LNFGKQQVEAGHVRAHEPGKRALGDQPRTRHEKQRGGNRSFLEYEEDQRKPTKKELAA
jgi:hypothetical protein